MTELTVHAGVHVVPAWQLHIADIVLPAEGDGPGRRVTGIRSQGAPPQVCVESSPAKSPPGHLPRHAAE